MSTSAQIMKFPNSDQDIWEREEAYVIRVLSKEKNVGEVGSPKFQKMVKLFTALRVKEFKERRDLEIRLLRDPENIANEDKFESFVKYIQGFGVPVQVAAIQMLRQRLFA